MSQIKFGTDGWRGLIAKDFTFENVTLVATAAAMVMKEKLPAKKTILVGYDCRFLSFEFAQCVATVFAKHGYTALIANEPMPTPVFSWCAKHYEDAAGAVVMTASHNPATWNGFKFKEIFGGSASPETTKAFEKKIVEIKATVSGYPSDEEFRQYEAAGKIKTVSPMSEYLVAIKKIVDVEAIRKSKFKIAIDTMYGSGSGHFQALLESIGVEVKSFHAEKNPGFGGTPPEPVEQNLRELCAFVASSKFSGGFASDGDADRLGAVDEHGTYFSTQKILSVVYWHMLVNRKKSWSIARSASTTKMVDLIAKKYGQVCYETPVGFKYIAEKIVEGKAQIGGEESGGIGIVDHIPERDSFLTALLLLELMATAKKGLAAVYADVCQEIRAYEFIRLDMHVPQDVMTRSMKRLQSAPPKEWNGREVETLSTLDGYKFYMTDGSWLLIRPSGTEPIFRLYADTESLVESQKLVDAAKTFVMQS